MVGNPALTLRAARRACCGLQFRTGSTEKFLINKKMRLPSHATRFYKIRVTILVLPKQGMAVAVGLMMRGLGRREVTRKKMGKADVKRIRMRLVMDQDNAYIEDALRSFDINNTNTLDFEEVRSWLKRLGSSAIRSEEVSRLSEREAWKKFKSRFPGASDGLAALASWPRNHLSRPLKGITVTDDDVAWVLMMVMEQKEKGSFNRIVQEKGVAGLRELELAPSDFESALHAWLGYIHCKKMLEKVVKNASLSKMILFSRDTLLHTHHV